MKNRIVYNIIRFIRQLFTQEAIMSYDAYMGQLEMIKEYTELYKN